MRQFFKIATILVSLVLSESAISLDTYYIIEKGDTLSEILFSLGVRNLYGEDGKVIQVGNRNQITGYENLSLGQKIWIKEEDIAFKCNYAVQGQRIRVFKRVSNSKDYRKLKKEERKCPSNKPFIQKAQEKIQETKVAEIPNEPFWKKKNYVIIRPYVDYSRIRFTDNSNSFTGIILSEANGGVYSEGTYYYKESMAFIMSFDLDHQRFATNSGRTILSNDLTTSNLGFGLLKHLNKQMTISGQLKYGDDLFFEAPDTDTITLDNSQNFKLELELEYRFVEKEKFYIDMNLGFKIISPTDLESYRAGNGMSYKVGTSIGKDMYNVFNIYKRMSLKAGVSYQNVEKDTNLFTQVHQHIQYTLSLKVFY